MITGDWVSDMGRGSIANGEPVIVAPWGRWGKVEGARSWISRGYFVIAPNHHASTAPAPGTCSGGDKADQEWFDCSVDKVDYLLVPRPGVSRMLGVTESA